MTHLRKPEELPYPHSTVIIDFHFHFQTSSALITFHFSFRRVFQQGVMMNWRGRPRSSLCGSPSRTTPPDCRSRRAATETLLPETLLPETERRTWRLQRASGAAEAPLLQAWSSSSSWSSASACSSCTAPVLQLGALQRCKPWARLRELHALWFMWDRLCGTIS